MAQSFSDMVASERERITKALVDINEKLAALNQEGAGYKRELAALDAYETTKAGKSSRPVSSTTRAQRGSRQETLLSILASKPAGMTRGEVLDELGIKGDKAQEGSISNALNNMKKAGKITAADGRYRVA